jgi:uncharacterized damage-inducible protein DinB
MKTIELLERVPDEWLTRTAEGEDMSLSWLFRHVADGPDWWMNHCMQDGLGWEYFGDGTFDRSTLENALRQSMKRVLTFFEAEQLQRMGQHFSLIPEKSEGEESWSGRNRILYLADHEVHHRGKIILALRQWGMKDFPFMPF